MVFKSFAPALAAIAIFGFAQSAESQVQRVAACPSAVVPANGSVLYMTDQDGNLCTSGSGGGGGGGAVTVASGADVTEGTPADTAYAGSGSATVVAALKGIYTSINAAISAGTNVIGGVFASLGTTNGWTPLRLSALSTTVTAIKSSAGELGMLQCYNPNAGAAYIQVFNLASGSVTLGTTAPTLSIPIGPTSTGGYALSNPGINFSAAMSIAATTTAAGLTALGTAPDCNVVYN